MQDRDWQTEMQLSLRRQETARRILGVCESDSAEETRRSWRKLCREHHPDRNDGSVESHRIFTLVNSAYRCLTKAQDCEQLDAPYPPDEKLSNGKYMLENQWGYFLWWREQYFD